MSFSPTIDIAANEGQVEAPVSAVLQCQQLIDAVDWVQGGRTPLFLAAMNGHVDAVETLHRLSSTALDRPDNNGRTPMHIAAQNGHVAVIEVLVQLGSTALDAPDKFALTPMHIAAKYGHAAVIETLHRLGSTALDALSKHGMTPIHMAALSGHAHAVETLYRLGSTALDWSSTNTIEWTPMHAAVSLDRASVVESLIRLGTASLHRSGAQLFQLAFERDNSLVAELLFAAGASVAPLANDWPEQVRVLLAIPAERQLVLRHRIYFSSTLLDVLLTFFSSDE